MVMLLVQNVRDILLLDKKYYLLDYYFIIVQICYLFIFLQLFWLKNLNAVLIKIVLPSLHAYPNHVRILAQ